MSLSRLVEQKKKDPKLKLAWVLYPRSAWWREVQPGYNPPKSINGVAVKFQDPSE